MGQIHQSDPSEFNLNKHLAFKYYRLAMQQRETEDEASLKLGDFYYNGIACKQDYKKATELYQSVVTNSRNPELRGHALLNLGMMHHFGLGTVIDLDMAQIYYEKAIKEESSQS